MKRLLYILIFATAVSCGGNKGKGNNADQGVVFAPKQQETAIVTKGPASKQTDPVLSFVGQVKLMIMAPRELDKRAASLLWNKMVAMTSINGVGSTGGSPTFILAPIVTEVDHDITATVPAKHKVKYNLNIYVANTTTGDVYASAQKDLMGVGDSKELALSNALSAINPSETQYQEMLKTAQDRILEFYNQNGDKLIKEAEGYLATNDYESAMTILNSIPMACGNIYDKALTVKNRCMDAYFQNEQQALISSMKAALAAPRDDENGYSSEFLRLYTMIPANSKAKKDAEALFTNYTKSLDSIKKQHLLKELRDYERAQKQLNREQELKMAEIKAATVQQKIDKEYELAMMKEKMAADIAIKGQTDLLEKYKKDAAYNRLPWIRKVLYLGDKDPFDGYTPTSNDL